MDASYPLNISIKLKRGVDIIFFMKKINFVLCILQQKPILYDAVTCETVLSKVYNFIENRKEITIVIPKSQMSKKLVRLSKR